MVDAAVYSHTHAERRHRQRAYLETDLEWGHQGGYTARGVGETVFTEADTIEELRQAGRDAVRCHFDPGAEPKVIRLHMVREG